MRISGINHFLFIIDNLDPLNAGINASIRWVIRFIRRCGDEGRRVKITCTSLRKMTNKYMEADTEFCDFVSKYDIHILSPTYLKYVRGNHSTDISMDDLIDHDKQYFRDINNLKNVTFIFVVAGLSHEVLLPGGFIDRIKEVKRSHTDIFYSNVEVILINQIHFELSELVCSDIYACLSIGLNAFKRLDPHLKHNKHQCQHICLFPTFDEFGITKPVHNLLTQFEIITLFSEELLVETSPGVFEVSKFLSRVSKCLGNAAKSMRVQTIGNSSITWTIHYPGLDVLTKNILEIKLNEYSETTLLIIDIEIKSTPVIANSIGKYCLCISSGNFSKEGFCGLETILCGIPSLVPSGSDVGIMIKDIDDMFAEYFTLNMEHGTDEQWSEKILQMLNGKQNTFNRAYELLQKYVTHSRKGSITCHGKTIYDFVRETLGLLS